VSIFIFADLEVWDQKSLILTKGNFIWSLAGICWSDKRCALGVVTHWRTEHRPLWEEKK